MRLNSALLLTLAMAPASALAQTSYKVEVLKEAPPASLSAAIRGELNPQGYRVVDSRGKPFAEFWFRKAVPASGKPAGPTGNVLFPVLAEGELMGALRFALEGHDYRDQPIVAGVYTLRYGLQPVNGDHLGVSLYRDYALLLPADKDTAVAALPAKRLEETSAEAAGTSHPAVLMLLPAPEAAQETPSVVHDEAKETWGVVAPLGLKIKEESATLPIQLVVQGVAAS